MKFNIHSYGGCGSKTLMRYLNNFGDAFHLHSNQPHCSPIDCKSIYIYRNPIDAIFSRFKSPQHLKHIKADPTITLQDVIESGVDLYGIHDFFNCFVHPKKKLNFPIYCVKFEDIFENIKELNMLLGIEDIPSLYPQRHIKVGMSGDVFYEKKILDNTCETDYSVREEVRPYLEKIYKNLINEMSKMKPIEIVQ